MKRHMKNYTQNWQENGRMACKSGENIQLDVWGRGPQKRNILYSEQYQMGVQYMASSKQHSGLYIWPVLQSKGMH